MHQILIKFKNIITIEDGCLKGGFGSSILEFIAKNNYKTDIKMLGIPDEFIHHGTQEQLHEYCFYDEKAIIETVHSILEANSISQVG